MTADTEIKKPALRWLLIFILLAIVGAGVSVKLTHIYIMVRADPNYESFCAINELANCDTVAISSYSTFMGIPVSIWGLAGFFAIIAFGTWGMSNKLRPSPRWPLSVMLALSSFAVIVSLVLFGISYFIIKSFCPLCMTIYLISFLMLIVSFTSLRSAGMIKLNDILVDAFDCLRKPRLLASGLLTVLLISGAIIAAYQIAFGQVKVDLPNGPGGLYVGVDEQGNHWIGAKNPVLVIEEFSDYECPFCRRAHQHARAWVAKHADEVRLVHRHLPLDHHCNPMVTRPFHQHSCEMARMAYCAGQQDKFWEMNDLLYSLPLGSGIPNLEAVSRETGMNHKKFLSCLESRYCEECLEKDIEYCMEMNLNATPTFIMEGRPYTGKIPAQDLQNALNRGRLRGRLNNR